MHGQATAVFNNAKFSLGLSYLYSTALSLGEGSHVR